MEDDWYMNIQIFAEILSAYAAIITVVLAVSELSARSKAKKADAAIEIYADFLFVIQQLQYAVANVKTLCEKRSLSLEEKQAFAKAHFIDSTLTSKAEHVETASITCFNYTAEEGRNNSKHVVDFIGQANNLIATINTFYSTVEKQSSLDSEWFESRYDIIVTMFKELKCSEEKCNLILKKNLKTYKNSSIVYLVTLLLISFVFLAICVIL